MKFKSSLNFTDKHLLKWSLRGIDPSLLNADFKEKVEAKNGLENYCFSIKNTISDEKLKDNIPEDDKKMVE